jgi:FlaA1/EpsC-like NDP-sugar epimerase
MLPLAAEPLMVKPRRNDFLIPLMLSLSDFCAIVGAFLLSYLIRFSDVFVQYFPADKGVPEIENYLLGGVIVAPLWMMIFNAKKVYHARRDIDLSAELSSIIKRVSYGMLIVMSLAFFYRTFSYSRLVILLIWLSSIPLIYIGRYFVFRYEKYLYRRGKELRNVILVGTNNVAQSIAVQLRERSVLGYNLIGFIGDDEDRIESTDVPRIGEVDDLPALIQEHKIETLIVCMTEEKHALLSRILDLLVGTNVQILLQF